ncbi:PREDICTED: protein NEN1 [Tarenaya hassleriana]|uniref:protein NEN1 n=1 Tax=Tarenaya hassleriana TaxID=28532 RepID=UPI00053C81C2|nr:PREDICTED: protein NEN1 [Tarenaya hassleriana]
MSPTPVEDRSEIAFFDVETTVPNRPGQRFAILEFGSILVCPRKLVELRNYSTLVRPADLSLISSLSVRCNGITRDNVVSAPSFADIADTVYDFLHGRIWAGHNILRFDCARIREAFAEIGRQPPEPKGTIDSLALLTQKFGRRAGDMKMATLATYFGLGKQTHRSLDDVRMNLEVLKYCATVLFLESSLPDALVESSVSPETSSRRRRATRRSLHEVSPSSTVDQRTVENDLTVPIPSTSTQPNPFDLSLLRNEVAFTALQSDIPMMEEEEEVERNQTLGTIEIQGSDGHSVFLEPDEVSVPNIKVILVPFYHGCQKMKLKLLHGDNPLQLHCPRLNVRFGINGKFLDSAGRRRLNFVVDLNPSVCRVLEACDGLAQKLTADSGSSSDWNPVVIPRKGFVNYPTARIHIPTEVNGDVTRYGAEIHQRDSSGLIQKLIFSNPSAGELESLLNPGTVVDAFLTLEPYDYQQRAGIRLVARTLIILS